MNNPTEPRFGDLHSLCTALTVIGAILMLGGVAITFVTQFLYAPVDRATGKVIYDVVAIAIGFFGSVAFGLLLGVLAGIGKVLIAIEANQRAQQG